MRYRRLDENGDYQIGRSQSGFLANTPECVAQAVSTRLKLWAGEWFLDTTEGTPYTTQVLGKYTDDSYDRAIQMRILETPGVVSVDTWASQYDGRNRSLSIQATITTVYGQATVVEAL